MKGSPYGIHRVLEPAGTLPQAAWKISNSMEICDNEILIDTRYQHHYRLNHGFFVEIHESKF